MKNCDIHTVTRNFVTINCAIVQDIVFCNENSERSPVFDGKRVMGAKIEKSMNTHIKKDSLLQNIKFGHSCFNVCAEQGHSVVYLHN